jgi:hypothetical protein
MTRHFLADDDLSPAQQAEVAERDEAENRRHAQRAVLAFLMEHSA